MLVLSGLNGCDITVRCKNTLYTTFKKTVLSCTTRRKLKQFELKFPTVWLRQCWFWAPEVICLLLYDFLLANRPGVVQENKKVRFFWKSVAHIGVLVGSTDSRSIKGLSLVTMFLSLKCDFIVVLSSVFFWGHLLVATDLCNKSHPLCLGFQYFVWSGVVGHG